MKTTELMKLGVGDSFTMHTTEGPETCTITGIRQEGKWHMIDYKATRGEATIHITLPEDPTEELGAIER